MPDFIEEEMVIISRKEYDSLKEDSRLLARLEAAGVDNWEGYPSGPDEDEEEY